MPIGVRKGDGSLRQLSPEDEAIYVRKQAALRHAGIDARCFESRPQPPNERRKGLRALGQGLSAGEDKAVAETGPALKRNYNNIPGYVSWASLSNLKPEIYG
jgi:hypothetical protein